MRFTNLRNSYMESEICLNGGKMAEAYVCKVTSVGQVTLPKEVRKKLGIGNKDYIIFQKVGDTYFVRKVEVEEYLLEKIRKKVKKSGITREKLDEVMREVRKEVWRKTYGKRLRGC